MDQFIDKEQIQNYNKSRSTYTNEVFESIIKNINGNEAYLDVACGCGQLTIPLSKHFKITVGLDASSEQISAFNENISKIEFNEGKHIYPFVTDVYDIQQKLFENNITSDPNAEGFFDLITIAQAFHWFDENKLLPFLKSLLKPNGILVIVGYKRHPFDPVTQKKLYEIGQKLWDKLEVFSQAERNHIDSAYEKSYDVFKKYFSFEDKPLIFIETKEIPIEKMISGIKSSSPYVNYLKSLNGQENYIMNDLDNAIREYYSIDKDASLEKFKEKLSLWYFVIILKK